MGFGKLTGLGIMADAGLHMVVALAIFATNITTVLDNTDAKEIAAFGVILVAASLLQGLYLIGLLLRIYFAEESDELEVGSILRNTLTGVGIVSSLALYGQFVKMGTAADNWQVTLAACLFALMRILDTIMNGKYENFTGIGDLWKHSCKDDGAVIVENANKVVYFTPRVIIVHVLLLLAFVASLLDLLPDTGYLKPVEGEASTANLIAAMSLQGLHFILYPIALIFNAFGCAGTPLISEEGECESRKELISLNRIPIVRSVVALVVLSCLSYAYGNLSPDAQTQLLLLNLALYFAADQIGFDVV